ncbi:MAG: MgtC/SapB family protein [Bacteroides sp.]|nr:MgtC/SapB family protein [Bacillota bacterium]MCM1393601.1 MgtC/SapB family protein [[Eubacterium] siraeum]MCM1455813.1 MgtC/SapB family protein [Bacteroides sp.]
MEQFLSEMHYLIGIVVSLVLGFAIGFERKLRSKEAGIRTHTIVCVGAALMVVVSKYGFAESADSARVAAQIVSGVGFLGAGIIMLRGQKMYGLTTAAGVWATAGVGMAAGAGLYYVALFSTVIIILIHLLFHINRGPFRTKKYYHIKITFMNTSDESVKVKAIFGVSQFNKLTIERKDNGTLYHALLNTDKEYSSQVLGNIMEQNPYILTIERCDDN